MNRFFIGLDGSGQDKMVQYPHVLVSSATQYKRNKLKIPIINPEVKEIFLDSGGFSFFTKWEKYPFSIEEYLQFINDFCQVYPQTRYAAIMDYPCENFVNRKSLKSNYQRIEETIKNTRSLEVHPIPAQWVSVVQGSTVDEYNYCLDLLEKNHLITDLLAIGSICTRKKIEEIFEILNLVHRRCPDNKIHAFGLEYQALKTRKIWDLLYSCDTAAWKFDQQAKWKRNHLCRGNWRPANWREKMANLEGYKQKINRLFDLRNGNESILAHLEQEEEWMLKTEYASSR